jgi:hypothetical protein
MPKITRTSPNQKAPATNGPAGTGTRAAERVDTDGFFDDGTIQVLLYGRAGSGKTTLWSSFPKPIRAIICSGGMRSGELKSVGLEDRDDIMPVRIRSSDEFKEVVASLAGGAGDYPTVVLDHASGYQDLVLSEVLGLSDVPLQKSFGMAQMQDYAEVTRRCKEDLAKLLDLRANVVVVAHERDFKGEGNSDVLAPSVGASLMPQLAGWLNGACNNIAQCFLRRGWEEKKVKGVGGKTVVRRTRTGPIEFCLRTGRDDVYTGRLRVPRGTQLPDVIVDPTYEKLAALLSGKE